MGGAVNSAGVVALGQGASRGVRAVKGRWSDAWAREEQEVDGGGQERRTAPAAEEPDEQRRRAEVQGGRREKKGAEDRFAKLKKYRDFTVKSL
jgi:hypothetical protein